MRLLTRQRRWRVTAVWAKPCARDVLGIPARRAKQVGGCETWLKPLQDASTAVALMNRTSIGQDITMQARDVGLLDTPQLVHNV